MQLTVDQQKALALDKNITVTAGAGSGKTRILVERFLKITLSEPQLTTRVAAITFTEKAAGEMRERIAAEINRCLEQSDDARERGKLLGIRDRLGSAHISTIHGFCSRLLREFPIEAGISPDFGMMDSVRQKMLQYQAMEQTFDLLDRGEHDWDEERLRQVFARLSLRQVRDLLGEALSAPFDMLRIREKYASLDEEAYILFLEQIWIKKFTAASNELDQRALLYLLEDIVENDAIVDKNEKGRQLKEKMETLVLAGRESTETMSWFGHYLETVKALVNSKNEAYKTVTSLGGKKSWSAENQEKLLQASDLAARIYNDLSGQVPLFVPNVYDRIWFDVFKTFLRIYESCQGFYEQLKSEEALLDFEDLQIKLYELLQNDEAIRQKLSDRFRYIMVDEFQDTNPLQWEIVRLLGSDEKKELKRGAIFVVGDPKQSIYGFRDADIRVFRGVKETFARQRHLTEAGLDDSAVVFRESFRFVPPVNAFINRLFEALLVEEEERPYEVGYEALRAMRQPPPETETRIELMLLDQGAPELSEAGYIAQKIDEILDDGLLCHQYDPEVGREVPRRVGYGDIAILLRDRGSLNEIEQALRQRDIPFKTIGGVGFWQQSEVYELYHLLRFLSNPRDDMSLVALLRSRLLLLSDATLFLLGREQEESWQERLNGALEQDYSPGERIQLAEVAARLNRWLELRERIPLSELLTRIVDETKLKTLLLAGFNGGQRVANLEKLLTLAENFDLSNPGGLKAFYGMIDDLIRDEVREAQALIDLNDAHSVKIMTIHVSKGLQFPVVFVPGLHSAPAVRAPILRDPELGMSIALKPLFPQEENTDHTLAALLKNQALEKERAEYKRIFYVAFSRASDHLFLSAIHKREKVKSESMIGRMLPVLFPGLETGALPRDGTYPYEGFRLHVGRAYPILWQKKSGTVSFEQRLKRWEELFENSPSGAGEAAPATVLHGRVYSATALKTFLDKPDEYYRRYMLGFFEGDYTAFEMRELEPEDDNLLKGTLIHRFLELRESEGDDQALIDRVLFEQEIFDDERKAELGRWLEEIKGTFHKSDFARWLRAAREYKNEVSVSLALGRDYITGAFDRLQCDERGIWEVIDYKSNNITEARLKKTAESYDVQMEIYALLLGSLFPEQERFRVTLYFLKIDKTHTLEFDREGLDKIRDYYEKLIEEIKNRFPLE